jgi:CBS domain containing-hemolysin-like protein
VKRYHKAKIQSNEIAKYRWAFRMFFISISLSVFFGFLSQTVLSNLGILFASIGIMFFIFVSVIFDMVGIAVASADIDVFEKWKNENIKGARVGLKLCINSEKVCSFCADVVGDICGTLCGAGGACIIAAATKNAADGNMVVIVSVLMSAVIAGLMIFFKAIMKSRALKNSNKIILKIGRIFEKLFYREKK